MNTPSLAAGRSILPRPAMERDVALGIGLLAVALLGLLVASRISFALFYATGAVVLATLAYLSYRIPRAMLIAVVFTPIVDRYLVSLLIPESLHGLTNYLSEALLLLVAISIGVRAWRDRALVPALRHPVVVFVAAFVGIGLLSAVVNGVPPLIAVAGIVFTVEAVALFVLPRAVGMTLGYAKVAMIGFTALATVAALLALGQVVLHADFLGMQSFSGRFNEGRRVAAFLVNPNMLGVVLAMAIPMPLLATTSSASWRGRIGWGTLTFVLALALLYTFSRGAWLGLAAAAVLIGLFLDPRALIVLVLFGFISYGSAVVLPRHVLEPDPGDVGFDLGAATVGRLDTISGGGDLRVLFVENAAPIIADHPILGAGPGRYGGAVAWRFGTPLSAQYTAGSVPRDRTVDNFWLHLIVEFGLLGSLVFASAIAIAVRRTVADARRSDRWPALVMGSAAAIAVIVGVDSISEMLLEGNTTSFPVWFFLGVASVLGAAAPRAVASRRLAR
ncbi:MAG TPA: O-antigen ligase family protein [Candidatus Limnocylindrales bacterium]|nr:O-antigen ligase family protein [Candidatus Limnocylindrales bacterium]